MKAKKYGKMEIWPDLSAFTKMGIATILMLRFTSCLKQNVQETIPLFNIDAH